MKKLILQKKQKNVLISLIVIISLLSVSLSLFYLGQRSPQPEAMSIFWDNERGNIMTGAHYNLGDTIIQLDANYVYPCDTYVGMYCWLKFHSPSGSTYGPFSKSMTWRCPPCSPPGDVFLIPVNIHLNTWGTWSIEYQFKGREEDRGWDKTPCFAGTLEFFVGDPVPCYRCEGYDLVSQDFYQEACPDEWQDTPPDCGTPPPEISIISYSTIPENIGRITLNEKSYVDGQISRESYETYNIHAVGCCGYEFERWSTTGDILIYDKTLEDASVTIFGDGSITAWYKRMGESSAPSIPGFEMIILVGAICVFFVFQKKRHI